MPARLSFPRIRTAIRGEERTVPKSQHYSYRLAAPPSTAAVPKVRRIALLRRALASFAPVSLYPDDPSCSSDSRRMGAGPIEMKGSEPKGSRSPDKFFRWLTGHSQASLEAEFTKKTSFEDFFAHAPKMNPSRFLITGVVCGVRVEEIQEPMMREIRYLDKLIDELAKGKAMEKILRK